MPKAQQDYYYSYARQNFVSFSDEDDPERINFLIEVVCVCVCVCVGMHVCSVHSLQTCVCMCVNAYVHACVLMRVPAHCGCGERGLAGRKPDARACVRRTAAHDWFRRPRRPRWRPRRSLLRRLCLPRRFTPLPRNPRKRRSQKPRPVAMF